MSYKFHPTYGKLNFFHEVDIKNLKIAYENNICKVIFSINDKIHMSTFKDGQKSPSMESTKYIFDNQLSGIDNILYDPNYSDRFIIINTYNNFITYVTKVNVCSWNQNSISQSKNLKVNTELVNAQDLPVNLIEFTHDSEYLITIKRVSDEQNSISIYDMRSYHNLLITAHLSGKIYFHLLQETIDDEFALTTQTVGYLKGEYHNIENIEY